MLVRNARILYVTFGMNDRNELSVKFSLEAADGLTTWEFLMNNQADVRRLTCLMEYAEAKTLEEMNTKIVRIVVYDNHLCAIGDPIKNNFFHLCKEEFEEINLELIEKMF